MRETMNIFKKVRIHTLLLAFCIICSVGLQAQTIKIAAAGNLRYVLDDIKAAYLLAHPKTKVVVNLGSS
ncbi:MAG: hypothetical protein RIS47_628, partial [Bacteroidota bacterium]